jgi:hypothetical protein
MSKILAGLISTVLFLGMSGLVMADTNIWTWVTNQGGYTAYEEKASVGGYDYSECSYQYTAFIDEGFENDGSVFMFKGVETTAPWELEEYKYMDGSGDTLIWKHVDVWTEDKRTDCCTGKLKYPTEAWVEVDFVTDKPFHDAESVYFLMDEPPAQHGDENGTHGYFDKIIETDEDFFFQQKVGINNWPSDFMPPEPPEPPKMHWIIDP